MPKTTLYNSKEETDRSLFDLFRRDVYAQTPCLVTGTLGLWDGRHTVRGVEPTLARALCTCMGEGDVTVEEDGRGNLTVTARHHDGVNTFEIRLLTEKGVRSYAAHGNTPTLTKPGYTSPVHLSRFMEEEE